MTYYNESKTRRLRIIKRCLSNMYAVIVYEKKASGMRKVYSQEFTSRLKAKRWAEAHV